jgi:hypothetical protein
MTFSIEELAEAFRAQPDDGAFRRGVARQLTRTLVAEAIALNDRYVAEQEQRLIDEAANDGVTDED